MIARAAVDYRGCIEADEVDGGSPVERAAATLCTRTCVDAVIEATINSGPTVKKKRGPEPGPVLTAASSDISSVSCGPEQLASDATSVLSCLARTSYRSA